MIDTKYDMVIRNGKEQFVMVPIKDYEALLERLEDDADFRAIEQSKKRNAGKPLIPHEQVMQEGDGAER
ncbi:MAG TPA: hypothetical protein VG269_07510 [Tepidisphaeraceae bacterium]|jgi:PHD/YefM family antitoxin component YafN of YafNO toxin-antitoxin module|nr:hypothetical protein [Tepidisphaeraceae bacterium]